MATIIAAIVGGILAVVAAIIGSLVATERLIITDVFRWRRLIPRGGFVIIINGGSGVGKTTVAWALARKLNIVPVLGTDVIREVIRYTIPSDASNPLALLLTSSFLAHHRLGPDLPEVKADKIVDAFRLQSTELVGPILRIINRVRTKRDPMIIEGVNILCSDVFERIPSDAANTLFFVNLYLDSQERHLARLRERGVKSLEFPELTDRYIREISSIRKIDSFLKEDTQHTLSATPDAHVSIISLENSGLLSHSVNMIEKAVRAKFKLLPTDRYRR